MIIQLTTFSAVAERIKAALNHLDDYQQQLLLMRKTCSFHHFIDDAIDCVVAIDVDSKKDLFVFAAAGKGLKQVAEHLKKCVSISSKYETLSFYSSKRSVHRLLAPLGFVDGVWRS